MGHLASIESPGKSRQVQWIADHLDYQRDDCLLWPFNRRGGYGRVCHDGKAIDVHRLMCIRVNGNPPTPEHHAAHSCGRGQDGCVNPRHVRTLKGILTVSEIAARFGVAEPTARSVLNGKTWKTGTYTHAGAPIVPGQRALRRAGLAALKPQTSIP